MSKNTKRYLISSLVSFLTGFALVLVSQVESLTLESLKDGTIVGILFLAVRTGFKGVLELFLAKYGAKETLQ